MLMKHVKFHNLTAFTSQRNNSNVRHLWSKKEVRFIEFNENNLRVVSPSFLKLCILEVGIKISELSIRKFKEYVYVPFRYIDSLWNSIDEITCNSF